jgi:flagellar basal-body rod protein FlgB
LTGILFDSTLGSLERGLDAVSRRHQIVADNLANADTPGFKRSEVQFSVRLAEALHGGLRPTPVSTSAGHMAGGRTLDDGVFRFSVEKVNDTSGRPDGNNVDMESEMSTLAENTILYQALARQVSSRFALLRTAIFEGRR